MNEFLGHSEYQCSKHGNNQNKEPGKSTGITHSHFTEAFIINMQCIEKKAVQYTAVSAADDIGSVSYTHLDVYKRQAI